mmetsp:Transcript_41653/g.95434  ORF Transcript_41653/g.95434 Transcript_41653/m.95434 type:complete len:433 (-) Transcript_41653:340-1638(-)
MADDDRGRVDQTGGEAHILHAGDGIFEPGLKRLGVRLVEGLRLGGLVHVQLSVLGGGERLAAVRHQVGHDKLVDGRVDEQHLDLLRREGLHVRRAERGLTRGREEPIDLVVLLGDHTADVVVERDQLLLVGGARLEAQQLGNLRLGVEVRVHALLEELAELIVELEVAFLVVLGEVLEKLDHSLGEHARDLLHERGVLHRLSRDIQRQVLRIDHSFEKSHPFGEQPLRSGLNEHLAAVQVDAALLARHAPLLDVTLWNVEDSLDRDGRVHREVERVPRVVERLRDVPIELVVLLLRHLVLPLEPDRLDRVDTLAVDLDGKANEAGVAPDVRADVPLGGEVGLLGLELDHDLCPRSHTTRLRQLVRAVAGRLPAVPHLSAVPTRVHRHLVRHHEHRVEADAELADHVGRRGGVRLTLVELLQEVLGARARDGA